MSILSFVGYFLLACLFAYFLGHALVHLVNPIGDAACTAARRVAASAEGAHQRTRRWMERQIEEREINAVQYFRNVVLFSLALGAMAGDYIFMRMTFDSMLPKATLSLFGLQVRASTVLAAIVVGLSFFFGVFAENFLSSADALARRAGEDNVQDRAAKQRRYRMFGWACIGFAGCATALQVTLAWWRGDQIRVMSNTMSMLPNWSLALTALLCSAAATCGGFLLDRILAGLTVGVAAVTCVPLAATRTGFLAVHQVTEVTRATFINVVNFFREPVHQILEHAAPGIDSKFEEKWRSVLDESCPCEERLPVRRKEDPPQKEEEDEKEEQPPDSEKNEVETSVKR